MKFIFFVCGCLTFYSRIRSPILSSGQFENQISLENTDHVEQEKTIENKRPGEVALVKKQKEFRTCKKKFVLIG